MDRFKKWNYNCITLMKSLRQFLHTTANIFKIYWEIAPGLTIGLLFTEILTSFQGLVYAYLFGVFVDRMLVIVNGSRDLTLLIPVLFSFSAVTLFLSILNVAKNYFSTVLANIDLSKLRLKQTDFLVQLGISQMEDPELTNKSTRFTEVSGQMGQHLGGLVALIATVVSISSFAFVIYQFASVIVFLSLIVFFVKYLNNGRYINKIWRLRRDNTEKQRNAWDSVSYLINPGNLKEIVLASGTILLRNKFSDFTEWQNNQYRSLRGRWSVWEVFHTAVDTIFFAFGVYLLAEKTLLGMVSIGSFVFYLRSLSSFSDQLNSLSYRVARTIEGSTRLQDALELFELYTPEENGTRILEKNGPPEIVLNRVTFKYPNGKYPVIKDMNVMIKSGERVAIVGENGAGKTTLVKLLTRIYRPQNGTVTVGGVDVNKLKKESLYHNLGVLFQDFNQYGNLTVSENIQMGKVGKKVDAEKIKGALVKADALNFVKNYPKGLDQVLSERFKGGIRPSGGQWQKLAIARFFYRNAPILILDEPTASIDAISEASIFDNIYKFMRGKTVIIISHRFSTVRNADRILVLDHGKIVEEGSHEELLQMDGKYAKAFRLQAKGYA